VIRKYFDNTKPASISNKFRRKRFEQLLAIIEDLPKPVKILDAGGTVDFWKQMGYANCDHLEVSVLNIEKENTDETKIKFIIGDARDLSLFCDNEFDIVFSNSVLEHVGTPDDQRKMASEIMRTGKNYFVQTPNYYFPAEPHFLFPFFQFLPFRLKVMVAKFFRLGWLPKTSDSEEIRKRINSIRLLTSKDLVKMFPGCKLLREKFFFLTKSFTVANYQ